MTIPLLKREEGRLTILRRASNRLLAGQTTLIPSTGGLARSSRLSASAAAYTPLTFEGDTHIVEGLASCAAPGAAFQAAFPAVWFANLRPEGGCRGCRV